MNAKPVIRELRESDSLEELTDLLHRAYKVLADMGLQFLATHQDTSITKRRVERGRCFVAECEDLIIGTVTVFKAPSNWKCEWYIRSEVMTAGQLAVEPEFQGNDIGKKLMNHVEEHAKELGALELALDTSEQATNLIEWYARLDYRFIQFVQWEPVNYRSVVMSKRL